MKIASRQNEYEELKQMILDLKNQIGK